MKGFKGFNRFTVFSRAAAVLAAAFVLGVFAPAAFAGEYFPVFVAGVLVGGFDDDG